MDWQNSYKTIETATVHLLNTGKFSDVDFIVGNSTTAKISAHKVILMTRSSVFETMFERWETEQNCEVILPEVDPDAFKLFLQFLYTNEFSAGNMTGSVPAELLYLAHKYNVKELALKCSKHLSKMIEAGNAVNLCQIANKLDQSALNTQTRQFILKNAKAVFKDDGFLEIEEEILCEFLKSDDLKIDELSVFRAVMRWAQNQCKILNLSLNTENYRNILIKILPLIRFPIMRPQDFTDEVMAKNNGILVEKDVIGLYMYFTAGRSTKQNKPSFSFYKNPRKFTPTPLYSVDIFQSSSVFTSQRHVCSQYYCILPTSTCKILHRFEVDRDITLHGVNLFPHDFNQGATITISISLNHESSPVLATKRFENFQVESGGNKLEFDGEVSIAKKTPYVIEFSTSGQGNSVIYRSTKGWTVSNPTKITCDNAILNFRFSQPESNCHVKKRTGLPYGGGNYICCGEEQIKSINFSL